MLADEAEFGVRGQQLEFAEIMARPIRVQIPANGIVELPAAFVPKDHMKSFNYVYLAVTEAQPNPLYLRNVAASDGKRKPKSWIPGSPPTAAMDNLHDADFQTVHTGFLSKFSFPAHTQNGTITIDALTDLQQ